MVAAFDRSFQRCNTKVGMTSGRNLPSGDVLQVIPRNSPVVGYADSTGSVSVSVRILPARRRKLTRVVFAALGACTLILVAAGITHVARSSNESTAMASTGEPAPTAPAAPPAVATPPAATPPAAAAAPSGLDAPTTGTLRLQRPAVPGRVWVDGQKITATSATVACGTHQVKVGAHGKAHSVDVPCGGELKLAK
jgi:hypothetical protein